VSAKDKGTGKEQMISIKSDGGLSEEEIKKMMSEAEANAEADHKKRELAEARNQAETAVFATEKSLKEHGDKVDAATRDAIEAARKAVSDELAKSDATAEDLKNATEKLTEAAMKLGEAIYKAQQAEAKPDQKPEDGVQDAEVTEK
jgi:molecular chaperone DnaK